MTGCRGWPSRRTDFLSDALTGLTLCLAGIYLVLAWIFSSWTRPMVVMAIIPFGLVGTIYGHVAWEVPLSMFTVVGLIGMTGIIINDSIVLVTTIDEYADRTRAVPAIIDGAADRLRPVLLTTLTTVLGLAPLLFERSQQAQFLKPTVITLVYGLGFGMVLVLLVVPSLMAMQHDVRRQMQSVRRALGGRAGLAGVTTQIVAALGAIWFALTIGWTFVTGALPAALGGGSALLMAVGLFVAGVAVLAFAGFVVAAFVFAASQKRAA